MKLKTLKQIADEYSDDFVVVNDTSLGIVGLDGNLLLRAYLDNDIENCPSWAVMTLKRLYAYINIKTNKMVYYEEEVVDKKRLKRVPDMDRP